MRRLPETVAVVLELFPELMVDQGGVSSNWTIFFRILC